MHAGSSSLKSALKRFAFHCRLYKVRFLLNEFHILAYHMISDSPNGFYPEVSTRNFERQINHLKRNYHIISLEEIAERIRTGRTVRRCAAITFDDGFRDNYEKAYPILRRHQIPATIFLTTGCIDTGTLPWFIWFRFLFKNAARKRVNIELEGQTLSFSLEGPPEKRTASDQIMRYLQCCPDQERLSILNELPSMLGVESADSPRSLMLTWDQIREMSRSGINFGAHTITHPVLSRISPEMIRYEIEGSKTAIEEHIGRPVKTFAYPFGRKQHYPSDTPLLLRDLGFECAVTTEPGGNSGSDSVYELKRSGPWEISLV